MATVYKVPTGDFVTTSNSGVIAAGATSATIGTGLTLPATNGVLSISYDTANAIGVTDGPETFSYATYTSGTGALTGMVRGLAGTTDVQHSSGQSVQSITSSLHVGQLQDGSGFNATAFCLGTGSIISNFTSTATPAITDVTGLTVTVTVPTYQTSRLIVVEAYTHGAWTSGAAGTGWDLIIREGSTILQEASTVQSVQGGISVGVPILMRTLPFVATPGSHTYKVSFDSAAAGTFTVSAASGAPAYIAVYAV